MRALGRCRPGLLCEATTANTYGIETDRNGGDNVSETGCAQQLVIPEQHLCVNPLTLGG